MNQEQVKEAENSLGEAERSSRPTPYKLPNGCWIEPGSRVRVPKDHINLIPIEDWDAYGLDIVEGEQSFGSELIQRNRAGRGDRDRD